MNILFMGGNELGAITLEKLINNNINVVGAVITKTKDSWYSGVDKIAQKYNINLYEEENINDSTFINKIRKLDIDLIVSVNFAQILKSEIINIPIKGCINTHASLLPKYRGRAPLNWAILKGEKEVGVTVHYIEEGIDTGDIIIQKKIEVNEEEYIGDILEKVKQIYPEIVLESVKLIENDKVIPIKQVKEKGSYFGKRVREDGEIDIESSPKDIINLIRALSRPYPGAYIKNNNNEFIIWKAKLLNKDYEFENENVKEINGELWIKLKDCILVSNDYDKRKKEGDL